MWASEDARTQTILRLLETAHLYSPDARIDRGLWTEEGPTQVALGYLKNGAPLSHGESLVLLVAFDLWNGGGGAEVGDLLYTLDARNLRAVCLAMLQRDGGVTGLLDEALNRP